MNGASPSLMMSESCADTLGGSGMLICPKCRTIYSSAALASCYRDGERLVDYERFVAIEHDPLKGKLIGNKYRLSERIGQGGMGTVYRAIQVGLNRPVAVKILKRELNVDPDTVARFHREANAMSLLTHPNTVRVYDFGQTDDGLLYLVMELLEGELITGKMMREGTLDVLEALRFTQQILRSLAEAHSKAIVHRDLKPDNIFVARVEGHIEPVIKVLDFGIAKVVAPDRRVDQFETQAGTVFGTPRYMSPEQAQGVTLDGRSDLYSVGTLLYQMLTGRAPFTDEDAVVVMAKHIRELPEEPNEVAPDRPIPRPLNDVVMRSLAKDPGARFQEAGEFEAALEGCVPEAEIAQAAALTGRWSHRPSRRFHLLYGACALMLFGVGYFGVRVYAKLSAVPPMEMVSAPLPSEPPAPPAAVAPAAEGVRPSAHEPTTAVISPVALSLRSEPSGAAVYRDGRRLGETPMTLPLAAHEELVRVELRLAGYQPLAAELAAQDGDRVLELTALRPKRGRGRAHESSARTRRQRERAPQAAPTSKPGAPEPSAPKPAQAGPYERFE
jgi:eukaryotic-like serine/threonine-protein kinase